MVYALPPPNFSTTTSAPPLPPPNTLMILRLGKLLEGSVNDTAHDGWFSSSLCQTALHDLFEEGCTVIE